MSGPTTRLRPDFCQAEARGKRAESRKGCIHILMLTGASTRAEGTARRIVTSCRPYGGFAHLR
eukprot:12496567-Alexandrium_andersonii.AAC.1